MTTIDVKDAAGATVAIEKPLVPGRAAAAASRPVALSSEDFAVFDGLETLITSTNTKLDTLHTDVDTLEAATGIVTETAPASDTASSGLNGRLQRVAQRLTSLIAQIPATLGVKASAASLSTVVANDDAMIGIVTETAPASDTASSGLNGRLQRIAQRITSMIALLPTALGQGTMATSMKVVLPSDQSAIATTPAGNVAAGAADSGNPLKVGGKYNLTLPTLTDGNRGDSQLDVNGNQRAALFAQINTGVDALANTQVASVGSVANQTAGSIRPLAMLPFMLNPSGTLDRMRGSTAGQFVIAPTPWNYSSGTTAICVGTTTAVTFKAAAGASMRNYITSMQLGHPTLGGTTFVAVRDGAGGTVLWADFLQITAGEIRPIPLPGPIMGAINTLLEIVTITSVTGGIVFNAQGYTGP